MPLLSIIIPVYNEAENIPVLYKELVSYCIGDYEIILVDDGSTDQTLLHIAEIAQKNQRLKCLSLSRNFGHQNALMAGMHYAKGDFIITMDGDLQHPPSLIPEMLLKLESGFDIVHTKRNKTENIGAAKKLFATFFYRFINMVSDVKIEPNGSDFRAFNKKVLNSILQFEERELFLRGLFSWIGFSSVRLEFIAPARLSGDTKYSYKKMTMLGIRGITSFSYKPLRVSLLIGSFISFFAFLFALFSLIAYFEGKTVRGWTSIIIAVIFFGGIQLLAIGLIGEYIAGLFSESKKRPLYLIKNKINTAD